MLKKLNGFKNHNIQKYVNKARKELKTEGLLTDNEFTNLPRVMIKVYVNYITDLLIKQMKKEYKKLYKKSMPKVKVKNET